MDGTSDGSVSKGGIVRAIEQGASEGVMDVIDDRRRNSIHVIVVEEEIVEVAIA